MIQLVFDYIMSNWFSQGTFDRLLVSSLYGSPAALRFLESSCSLILAT